ncbi:MAG: nucleoside 2-deoxyribosyltransferase [Nitrososphaerales archaeon]
MVCGAIANNGVSKIRRIQSFLREKGFYVIDQISNKDYSEIKDFRDKKDFAEEIVKHDLNFIKESDILITIADKPSFGAAIEIYFAKNIGKKVVIMSKNEVSSPWPIAFSDKIVRDEEELLMALKEFKDKLS